MPVGGARPGAGRPAGSKNKKTKEMLELVAREGITPLEVMIDNMRFAYEQAQMAEADAVLSSDALELIRNGDHEGAREVIARLVQQEMNYRTKAQECARDAAPYMHPRLATVTVGNKPGETFKTENVSALDVIQGRLDVIAARRGAESDTSKPH
jgi:hypothetical protein